MKPNLSGRSFRPELESLETRDLLSQVGFAIFQNLVPPLAQELQLLQSTVTRMQADSDQLKTDVASAAQTAASPNFTQAVLRDAVQLGNDLGIITTLNTQIQAQIPATEQVMIGLVLSGQADQMDVFLFGQLALPQFNTISGQALAGLQTANSLSTQAGIDVFLT